MTATRREFRDGTPAGICRWGADVSGIPAQSKPTWRTLLKCPAPPHTRMVVAQDRIVLAMSDGEIRCLELNSGKLVWQTTIEYKRYDQMLNAFGGLVVACDSVIELETGKTIANLAAIRGVTGEDLVTGINTGDSYYDPIDVVNNPHQFIRVDGHSHAIERVELPLVMGVASPCGQFVVGWPELPVTTLAKLELATGNLLWSVEIDEYRYSQFVYPLDTAFFCEGKHDDHATRHRDRRRSLEDGYQGGYQFSCGPPARQRSHFHGSDHPRW